MYSVLQKSEYCFNALAVSKVTLLVLDRSVMFDKDTKIDRLMDSINFGNELIKENGVPIQDFKIHPCNRNKKIKHRNTKKYYLKEIQK